LTDKTPSIWCELMDRDHRSETEIAVEIGQAQTLTGAVGTEESIYGIRSKGETRRAPST